MASLNKLCVSSYLGTTSSNSRYCMHMNINSEPSVVPYVPEMQFSPTCSECWPLLLNPLKMCLFCRLLSELFKCCDTLLTMKTSAALHFCTALSHGQLVRFVLDIPVCFLGLYAPVGRDCFLLCSEHQAQGLS